MDKEYDFDFSDIIIEKEVKPSDIVRNGIPKDLKLTIREHVILETVLEKIDNEFVSKKEIRRILNTIKKDIDKQSKKEIIKSIEWGLE